MTENHHAPECGSDVAAYALGSLGPADAEAFRAHLRTCAVCRDELEAFQRVVDTLPLSAPVYEAPSELRSRVMDAVRREPRSRVRANDQRSSHRHFRGFAIPRPALALGATIAIAVATLTGIEIGSSGSAGTHIYPARVAGSGSAEVMLSSSGARLVVHNFPAPPRGHIYEVWLERPGQPPAPTDALFSVSSKGDGDVDVPGDLHHVSTVLVTPEPDGGSTVPTHTPVISVRLS